MKLSDIELNEIVGGTVSRYGLVIAFSGLITFIIGMVDGYLRPLKCNK